mmetsp:Transcript_19743/g.37039  ORF Transcript_19743/g.37039 Transcript_19743/m.37039 type:complete len:83 (-) Transcript_19743:374-622(-)
MSSLEPFVGDVKLFHVDFYCKEGVFSQSYYSPSDYCVECRIMVVMVRSVTSKINLSTCDVNNNRKIEKEEIQPMPKPLSSKI